MMGLNLRYAKRFLPNETKPWSILCEIYNDENPDDRIGFTPFSDSGKRMFAEGKERGCPRIQILAETQEEANKILQTLIDGTLIRYREWDEAVREITAWEEGSGQIDLDQEMAKLPEDGKEKEHGTDRDL